MAVFMLVAMAVIVRMIMMMHAARLRWLGGGQHQLAHLHALGADQAIGQQTHFPGTPTKEYDFKTAAMVEMNVCGGDDFFQMFVL